MGNRESDKELASDKIAIEKVRVRLQYWNSLDSADSNHKLINCYIREMTERVPAVRHLDPNVILLNVLFSICISLFCTRLLKSSAQLKAPHYLSADA